MKNRSAARKYAKVIMKTAPEDEALEKFQADAQIFASILDHSPSIRRFFFKPLIGKNRKLKIFKAVCSKIHFSGQVERFLTVLIENERLDILDDILASLREMKDEKKNIVTVEITTASELDAALKKRLSALFSSITGKNIRISASVDPAIIGGIVTKVGSSIYDGTIKAQLSRMKEEILGE